MARHRPWHLEDREITPEDGYVSRRVILSGLAAAGLVPAFLLEQGGKKRAPEAKLFKAPDGTYPAPHNAGYEAGRALTDEKDATSYNNFYEFSLDKRAVRNKVSRFSTAPWKIEIAGLVEHPGTVDLEDFFKHLQSEERVYRFRCVEAWAMTVPWTGFPMVKFLEWVQPKKEARFVRMVSALHQDEMPNAKGSGYAFPYYEALTLKEAANELTLLAHGLYGKELPRQNGAPLRLVVPWKYGLKNIKSIKRFEFTKKRPPTFWHDEVPSEYSWLSNVEPDVPHPRWSQATERLIPSGKRIDTLPYNGYANLVAGLYKG